MPYDRGKDGISGKSSRKCLHCGRSIPKTMRLDAKYCRPEHRKAAAERRRRQRKAAEEGREFKLPQLSEHARDVQGREEIKRELRKSGLWDAYLEGRTQQVEISKLLNVTQSMVKRAMDELRNEDVAYKADEAWVMSDEMHWMLALDLPMPDLLDFKACRVWAEEATQRFLKFELHIFVTERNVPYLREEFHIRWIFEILLAFATGGYLQILSPPRHGKSELLTHLVIWLICRNPNIRILWFGPNDDIVQERILVMEELLENPKLVEQVLPPSKNFAPLKRGSGTVWTSTKFKVDCRASGITGNTVTGIGRGKKILSLNADLVLLDDIEDFVSTKSEENRASTRTWFQTQVDSRKEEHTPLIFIGSRQHADDLYGYNLEDSQFRNIVNSAHSSDCRKDPEDPDIHTDCMLFPQLRTYRFLMTKKHGAESRETAASYEMVWLNEALEEGYQVFPKPLVASSFNEWRVLGNMAQITGEGRRLIAGLDPSATGFQAGFLWCLTWEWIEEEVEIQPHMTVLTKKVPVIKRWALDAEERKGGGVDNAIELFSEWLHRYGLRHWMVESDGFNAGFRRDPKLKKWAEANDVKLEPHQTKDLKFDPNYGVASQRRLFQRGLIDLPYGDAISRAKMNVYQKQLTKFSDDPIKQAKKRNQGDTMMAAWFPMKAIRRLEKELQARTSEVKSIDSDYPVSYPGLSGFTTQMNQAPWSR